MSIDGLKLKYPDRIPVYVKKKENSDIDDVPKPKYLVPKEMTMGNMTYIIRKNIKLTPDKAMFVFVDNKLVPVSQSMGELYNQHKNDDGFLYIIYSAESTFG
jgi:GABA(A) receptor-associated protein